MQRPCQPKDRVFFEHFRHFAVAASKDGNQSAASHGAFWESINMEAKTGADPRAG
jgi:hypothetical protein